MAYKDLREFIAALEKKKVLKRVTAEVSPVLEITEITDRVVKGGGPALLFERVKGHRMPVLTNAFGSFERMNLALGTSSLDDIGQEVLAMVEPESPKSFFDKLKLLPKLKQFIDLIPKRASSGPCKEVVELDKPSLEKFPILQCWPKDAGRYITLPIVLTKDPETGIRNAGVYRLQVIDERTTGMHWHVHKGGAQHFRSARHKLERLEAAVAIGADPAVVYAATAPLPDYIDEMLLAGLIRKKPVELVPCETVDLEVPAEAEIVLEGYVDFEEKVIEGPFGDHTGYYSTPGPYPVFRITAITHRANPIYMATVVGRPPMEDYYIGKATERIFLPLIKKQIPEIVDMELPAEGVFHNLAVVSIEKNYPGQAQKVMHALWGLGQLMFTKIIVIVDASVNVHDMGEVLWRLGNNIDPLRDTTMVKGPVDELNHAAPQPNFGSKMGIDATKKLPEEGHPRPWPEDIEMSREIKALVDKKWPIYGI